MVKNDFLGIGKVSLFNESKKQKKRRIIQENRERGKFTEIMYTMSQGLNKEIVRTGKGHDYKVRTRDPWTGRVIKTEYHEVKSGKARISNLQNRTKRKMKGRYKVVRYGGLFE